MRLGGFPFQADYSNFNYSACFQKTFGTFCLSGLLTLSLGDMN